MESHSDRNIYTTITSRVHVSVPGTHDQNLFGYCLWVLAQFNSLGVKNNLAAGKRILPKTLPKTMIEVLITIDRRDLTDALLSVPLRKTLPNREIDLLQNLVRDHT
jgi:hypothetical protein